MTITKRIVCLANSRKLHGRCVAGRELVGGAAGPWIRPISGREHQEVSEYERQYEDGSDPRVLDVIDVPLVKRAPGTYQQENWELDPTIYWTKIRTASWESLEVFAQASDSLWVNGHSTYNGLNDTIPEIQADGLRSSLTLVHVNELNLRVFAPAATFGDTKRRVQAAFEHAGTPYRFWVTDPVYERRYLAQPDGWHRLGECYLTVSLGEAYKSACYKLVAAIIEPPAVPGGAKR